VFDEVQRRWSRARGSGGEFSVPAALDEVCGEVSGFDCEVEVGVDLCGVVGEAGQRQKIHWDDPFDVIEVIPATLKWDESGKPNLRGGTSVPQT